MKVLNLYAGIGGNRKLWDDVEVTAVENNPNIAAIYQDFYPDDTVVVGDAHQYLLDHYQEFDFIWSSPPCPSHSKLNTFLVANNHKGLEYPDMRLYQEILLLQNWHDGAFVVENVVPYYPPLIEAQRIHRHLFWASFLIYGFEAQRKMKVKASEVKDLTEHVGISLDGYEIQNKRQILRNCVLPELGKHILDCARGSMVRHEQGELFG